MTKLEFLEELKKRLNCFNENEIENEIKSNKRQ